MGQNYGPMIVHAKFDIVALPIPETIEDTQTILGSLQIY